MSSVKNLSQADKQPKYYCPQSRVWERLHRGETALPVSDLVRLEDLNKPSPSQAGPEDFLATGIGLLGCQSHLATAAN